MSDTKINFGEKLSESLQKKNSKVGLDIPSKLLDLPVELSIEVGRKRFSLAELNELQAGSVFELNEDSEHLLNIYVQDTLVAHAEVVKLDQNKLGIRIVKTLWEDAKPLMTQKRGA